MDAYSMNRRERRVRARDGWQGTQAQIAQRFGGSTSFITKLFRRLPVCRNRCLSRLTHAGRTR